ncbi:4-(cytidine 5'-diphospho)-2-C-methyl-D-erythritol kinase [Candidatus Saganbacteria bacterium]|nr:4-(cytidine 5'-diphospho)-2-C-methyl-D-erythritol kinase [Candidatus Saganbacteria bacterium]
MLKAHAKINLALQVIGKREDGYHEIDSIMQSVSLCDYVSVSRINNGIELTSDNPQVPLDNKNTAYKAAEVFFDKTGVAPSVKIDIKKIIPIAAGLAGGSADAAAVLIGLNQLYQAKLSESNLSVLGAEVGSDVPFCLVGSICRCRGRGELVEKIPDPKSRIPTWYIIVKPDFSVSTKWVYDNFDLVWIAENRLVGTHHQMESISLFNDLEKVVLSKFPKVQEIKKQLIQLGCLQAIMSGSGPSVFGLAPDKQTATRIYNKMKQEYSQAYIVEPVGKGIEVG